MTPRRLQEIAALITAGQAGEPLAAELRAAAEADTGDPSVLVALGRCYLAMLEWERGVSALQLASVAAPSDASVRLELGDGLAQIGATVAAMRAYSKALDLSPDKWQAVFGRAQGHHLLCRIDEALKDYDAALKMEPGAEVVRSFRIVALNYRESDQHRILKESRKYGRELEKAEAKPPAGGGAPGKIRVGILSSELRVHSVTYFLAPLLERAPQDFDVVLYNDSVHADQMTARLQSQSSGLVQANRMGNEALLQAMRADGLDVALDLGGHFSRNRLPVFAAMAAPLQVAYLGYPNTTGLSRVAWRIGDEEIDAFPGSTDHWTERLANLRRGMLAYEPPSDAPPAAGGPDAPVFGYFGHLGKISPEVGKAWGDLLSKVPGSRLLVKGDALADPEALGYWKAKLGAWLPVERVDFRQKTAGRAEHLAMYGDVSVTLDTWPYNGTTTTCESLWMGVPVVTLQGGRHASRVGASLLRGTGMGDLVAADPSAYVEKAASLAAERRRVRRADLVGARWLQHDEIAEEFWSTLRSLHREGKP